MGPPSHCPSGRKPDYAADPFSLRLAHCLRFPNGMEEPMRKTKKQTPKSKPADTLLKTSKKKDIELTEKELGKVSGGLGATSLDHKHKDQ